MREELTLRGLVPEDAITVAVGPGRTPAPDPTRVTVGIEQVREERGLSVRIERVVIVQPTAPAPPVSASRAAGQTGPSDLARFLEARAGASR